MLLETLKDTNEPVTMMMFIKINVRNLQDNEKGE